MAVFHSLAVFLLPPLLWIPSMASRPPAESAVSSPPPKIQVDENWISTKSGLQYVDIIEGKGPEIQKGQVIQVHYVGRLQSTGKEFDNSMKRGRPLRYQHLTHRMLPGWDEALGTMKAGGKRQVLIPPELAYGSSGDGGQIPPKSTLFYEIELVEAEPLPEPEVPEGELEKKGKKTTKTDNKSNTEKEPTKTKTKL